jgi:hypothetical protein
MPFASAAVSMLEHRGIGIADGRRALTRDAALVEQAEQTAAGECTLESPGERGGERLADRHAREVGEDAVDETLELELAGSNEPDQRVLGTRKRSREGALGGSSCIVALGHVVLKEPGRAVGPRLARAERAVVRVFRRTGVGRQIDRASCEQLVQLLDLGSVLLGRRPGPVDDRAAFLHEPLACLKHLLLVEQGSRELLDLAPLLRRRFGRQPAQRLGHEPLALGLGQRLALGLQPGHDLLVGDTHLVGGLDLLGPELRELRVAHRCRLRDQLVDLLRVCAVFRAQRLDLGNPPLVLGDGARAALVRDAEQRALELARDPLQVLRPVLHACSVVGSRRRSRSRRAGVGWPFQKGDPGLGLIAGTPQLVELALQGVDLRRVDEGREAERRRLAQLLNPPLQLLDRRAGQIELVAQRAEALLLGGIEQALPGDAGLAGHVGEPSREIGDHRRGLERCPGEVRRDHLRERIQLSPGPLGIAHQVLVQHDAEITRPLAHLFERIAAATEQVNERHALGVEQLEGKPHPLRRVFDAGKRIADISEQVLAAAQVAALVAQRDAHLRQGVLGLAGALRRLRRTPGEALQRHIQRLLDAGGLGGKPQLLQRLDADPDLVRGLADRIRRRDRAIDQGGEAADRRDPDQRATKRANAGAEQLRLAAEALQPTRGAHAGALDALQALLAALAD